jgi:opine dehydrogenase
VREVVTPVHEWLRTVYGHVTEDSSTVGSCLRTGPIQARKAPMIEVAPGCYRPNFQYRYMSEDVPYGLVATRALAQIAGVRTPMIDEVLTWAQSALGRVYLVDGELTGADAAELPLPQNHGVRTVAELVAWYAAGAPSAAPSQQRNPAPT